MHVAWEALDDAAIVPSSLRGRHMGVYVGASTFDYCQLQLHRPHGIDGYLGTGTTNCILANRLSYFLDLRGPSLAIDTACSSSLVAVHLACQSLRSGESSLALAGGVNVIAWPWVSVAFSKAGFMAADGRCKAFDARADGYVRGEGVGVVVLKRLADALADGDRIEAVLLGSAVNQDGRSNGLAAPNPRAQVDVLRAALDDAHVSPAALQYVEAHGTGTRLGDPIEVKSLAEVLETDASRTSACRLGSVKSNIGHLEAAAGVAGLIKVVLAFRHRVLPASLHLETPNPLIPFARLPVAVQRQRTGWPAPEEPLVAGISSFGFGGTNAHLVVAAPPPGVPNGGAPPPAQMVVLSARSREALDAHLGRTGDWLAGADERTVADVCHTLRAGRERFAHRFAAVASNRDELVTALGRGLQPEENYSVPQQPGRRRRRPRIAFLFTGQGAQFPGMARALAEGHPRFRRDLTELAAAVDAELGLDLLATILPPADADLDAARLRLEETIYTQTSLFCVELALARLWETLGVRPDVLFGHSIGEVVAACLAGVFSVDDAVRVVCERARLMQEESPRGTMAAVTGDRGLIRQLLAAYPTTAALAGHNGPRQTVISGDPGTIDSLCGELSAHDLAVVPLAVTRGFHSPLMADAAASFKRFLEGIELRAPGIPIHSNTTGAVQIDAMATPAYWAEQILQPVHFEEAMNNLLEAGPTTCIEIGPHPVLTTLATTLGDAVATASWLPSLRRHRDDWTTLFGTLRDLELQGVALDWRTIGRDLGAQLSDAPTYPFESRRYWRGGLPTPPDGAHASVPAAVARAARPARGAGLPERFRLEWRQHAPATAPVGGGFAGEQWIVVGGDGELRAAWEAPLHALGIAVRWAERGQLPELLPETSPVSRVVVALAADLGDDGRFASVTGETQAEELLSAVRALATAPETPLWIVNRGAAAARGGPPTLSGCMAEGLARVFALEHPAGWGGLIDVPVTAGGEDLEMTRRLLCELQDAPRDSFFSVHGGDAFVPRLVAVAAPDTTQRKLILSGEGSYLVTGGLGVIGLHIAGWLAAGGAGRIVLLGRREPSPAARTRLAELEATGCEIVTLQGDITSSEDMARLWPEIAAGDRPLRGVLHAAGALQATSLVDLDHVTLANVTRAKTVGGLMLDELTRDLAIDFFVLFSSIASVWGTRSLGAYAAGNRFLDGLAALRRDRGLPGTSISWGPWGGGGMSAHGHERELERLGVGAMAPEQALAALESCLDEDSAHTVVAHIDWGTFLPLMETVGQGLWLATAAPRGGGHAPATGADDLMKEWAALSGRRRETAIVTELQSMVGVIMGSPPGAGPDPDRGFFDMGFDSMMAVELRNRLERGTGRSLPATLAFDHPTIRRLAAHLAGLVGERATVTPGVKPVATAPRVMEPRDGEIAIVGMACRLPGASSPEELWQLLADGVDTVTEMPAERRRLIGLADDGESFPGAYLDDVDRFDARFFGIATREARVIDPQHRILFEVSWQALEHAGWARPTAVHASTGVFVGITTNDYSQLLRGQPRDEANEASLPYFALGNALNAAAGRIAYSFGLQGPTMAIDTACSSSLVAVHNACSSLRDGECDLALAGGVNLILDAHLIRTLAGANMLSPTGRCRTFDDAANGYVRGEGCGVLVLKRLGDAERDGDRIVAVIAGSAVNQDGPGSGFTVPNGGAQRAVITQALARARLDGSVIDYVEAHGTGTPLGDPIEIATLADTLGPGRAVERPLLVGAVKTNLGHLESASGVASILKVVLALQHEMLPRQLHLTQPNRRVDWDAVPIRVTTTPRPWPRGARPRTAGVSSFGISGTNAHLVLREAPEPGRADPGKTPSDWQLLPCSARSPEQLSELAACWSHALQEEPAVQWGPLAAEAGLGRRHFAHRLAVVARSPQAAATALTGHGDPMAANRLAGEVPAAGVRPLAFFCGDAPAGSPASQEPDPGWRELPAVRATFAECASGLPDVDTGGPAADARARLTSAAVERHELIGFVEQLASARLLISWGIHPETVCGAGVGRWVAAVLAEALTPADAVRALLGRRGATPPAAPVTGDIGLEQLPPGVDPTEWVSDWCGKHAHDVVLLLSRGGEPWEAGELPVVRAAAGRRPALESAAALYAAGHDLDWETLYGAVQRSRHALPGTPLQRSSYWVHVESSAGARAVPPMVVTPMPGVAGSSPGEVPGHSAPRPSVGMPDDTAGILEELRALFARILQEPREAIDVDAQLLDLGADSIVLMEAVRAIESRYQVSIPIQQLFEELSTLTAISRFLGARRKPGPVAPSVSPGTGHVFELSRPVTPTPSFPVGHAPAQAAGDVSTQELMRQQLETVSRTLNEVVQRQLEFLGGAVRPPAPEAHAVAPETSVGPREVPSVASSPSSPSSPEGVPFPPVTTREGRGNALTPQQEQHLRELVSQFETRTRRSKERAAAHRRHLADNRASVGFKFPIKEMLYPIVAERSSGARVWDVDGNEYIDISMGFGVHLFGHQPPFVMTAVERQLTDGLHLGPQSNLAGEVAGLIAEVTGLERVAFSNTGTEAVMTALRLARAETGRRKVALFAGSYHGHSDGVLAMRSGLGGGSAVPAAIGISPAIAEDLLVLDYDSVESLDVIRAHAGELAAVIVEPVQSRRPALQPREFLHELRKVTHAVDAALVFDEMITGFRVAPGGAQEWFGLQADLATYGKIVGGGMPIGVVAGSARFMDRIDGGQWQYGDKSYPAREMTFFAGTFCKHPLTMAVARAVLLHLRSEGAGLQAGLNHRTQGLAERLNAAFQSEGVPIKVAHYGSLFRFVFERPLDLFFYHLALRGLYVWEGRNFFLSTAHTDDDIERIIEAVRETVVALRGGGFLPRVAETRTPRRASSAVEPPAVEQAAPAAPLTAQTLEPSGVRPRPRSDVDFSVIFFSDAGRYPPGNRYQLVFDIAEYVDQRDFSALWVPERHFHSFGGIYSNPGVLAAALATRTRHIRLRAGSIVLPLHHPALVAETWAMIDNLSGGRVDLAFASGWNPNDFVVSPDTFARHKQVWRDRIPVVQALWRQQPVTFLNGAGEAIDVTTFPPPVQAEPGVWLTATRLAETFEYAGHKGYNVLTMLMGSTLDELGEKISLYRRTRERSGFDPDSGVISLMLHTFVHPDGEFVRQQVRDPFHAYIQSAITSHAQAASRERQQPSQEDLERLAELSFERYSRTAAMIGSPQECRASVRRFAAAGVNEIACLCDFGAAPEAILASLPHLDAVRRSFVRDHAPEWQEETAISVTAGSDPPFRRVPLAVVQRQHAFLARLDPAGSIAHNDLAGFDLEGELDVDLLRSCLQACCRRHDALRIVFDEEGQHQRILGESRVELISVDHTPRDGESAEDVWNAWLAAEVAHEFDLAEASLLRVHVFRRSPVLHRLVLTSNQIVLDGWSLGLLLTELATLYNDARESGHIRPQQLAPAPSYEQYVRRQLAYRDSGAAHRDRAFWGQSLSGELPVLALPQGGPRPAVQTYRARTLAFRLSRPRVETLRRLARQTSATPFMVLLAAHAITLRRFTGQDDLIIGTPVAVRDGDTDASLVGYATNLLPIRCPIDGRMSGVECIQAIRRQLLVAFEHQRYPFGDVLEDLQLERDLSRPPLVGTTFNFDRPMRDPGFEGARATLHPLPFSFVPFDLTLNVIEDGDELLFYCVYNRDLLDEHVARDFLDHYDRLLDTLAATPGERISRVPTLAPDVEQRILVDWNQTAVDHGPERTAVERIERELVRRPDAIVAEEVVDRDGRTGRGDVRQLSAGALDRQSRQVALGLLAAGAAPEAPVALLAERDLDFWVTMLGILRAGAAYLPIDPGLPAKRIVQVLETGGAGIVITRPRHRRLFDEVAGLLATGPALTRLVADELLQHELPPGRLPPSSGRLDPRRLAYMLFTSGSTGRPKCVMVEHGGMLNHIWAKLADLDIGPGDVVAQNGPASFDVSVWQWLGPLMVGARATIIPDDVARDPAALADVVADTGVNVLEMVPSLLTGLVDELERRGDSRPSFDAVRWMVPTGETLPPALCRRWLALVPHAPLMNTYGHTECSDDEVHWKIHEPPAENEVRVPVGRPIGNLRTYVMDADLQPVPPGVTGDIYMGGIGVGRGYRGRAGQTAAAFLPDPFCGEAGARIYRTGDRGRWRPEGCLDYLGRGDSQVKLGGHRIELDEIEVALQRHDTVADVVVVVRTDQPGIDRLVAYVVEQDGRGAAAEGVISAFAGDYGRFLRERLPESMVPALFVTLPALPLNANGKTDRHALPAPDLSVLAGEERQPATPTEARLARLWSEVLGVEAVGMNDSFFALGGHSLVATRLFSRMSEELGTRVPLPWIFEAPSVRQLARRVDEHLDDGAVPGPASATSGTSGTPRPARLPLSFPQQGVWFLEQLDGPSPTYNLADVVRLEGALDVAALRRALAELLERHEALRLRFRDEDGESYAEVESTVPLERVLVERDLRDLTQAERPVRVRDLLREEAARPFDLEHAPLLRVLLVREADDRYVLSLVVHHLVSDGWSLGVIVRDLTTLYLGPAGGPDSSAALLQPLRTTYADFALWERRERGAAELEPLLAYWRDALRGAPLELVLPQPEAAGAAPGHGRTGVVPLSLEPDLIPDLERLAGSRGATLFMALFAAFHAALARVSGQGDLVIGTPLAHRDRPEWEDLVGMFASALPLRMRAAGDASSPPCSSGRVRPSRRLSPTRTSRSSRSSTRWAGRAAPSVTRSFRPVWCCRTCRSRSSRSPVCGSRESPMRTRSAPSTLCSPSISPRARRPPACSIARTAVSGAPPGLSPRSSRRICTLPREIRTARWRRSAAPVIRR